MSNQNDNQPVVWAVLVAVIVLAVGLAIGFGIAKSKKPAAAPAAVTAPAEAASEPASACTGTDPRPASAGLFHARPWPGAPPCPSGADARAIWYPICNRDLSMVARSRLPLKM